MYRFVLTLMLGILVLVSSTVGESAFLKSTDAACVIPDYMRVSDERERGLGLDVLFYEGKRGTIYGFEASGTTGYSEYGTDIVAAAASVLIINTVNSINEFTDAIAQLVDDPEAPYVKYVVPSLRSRCADEKVGVLLKSLYFGLWSIEQEYGEQYVKVRIVTAP